MIRFLLLVTLVSVTVGCAKDSHEEVTREYLDVMRELLKVCNSLSEQVSVENSDTEPNKKEVPQNENAKAESSQAGHDESKTTAAKEKIGELLTQLKQLQKRLDELGDVDQSTRDKITKKYKGEFESLNEKFSNTISRIKKQEKVAEALESELKTLANLLNAKVG